MTEDSREDLEATISHEMVHALMDESLTAGMDLDMADEMVQYLKSNILLQVGQSMLAQANQQTSTVLSLLR